MNQRIASLITVAALLCMLPACKPVPLTAAEGAELSMSANPTAIPVEGGVSTITVVAFKSAEDGGGPVTDGTQIFFSADLGIIEERVETENGIARAFLRSNGRSGTANVTARSGAGIAAEAVQVEIGLSGDPIITVTANPATLGPFDISSEITATVTDANGNPIANAPVIFGTDAGSLASAGSVLRTNVNGQAFDRLTLLDDQGNSASVTATSGSTSSSVTVSRATFDPPIIDSVFPPTGARGATLTLTITGQNFRPGATVGVGTGVDIREVVFVNSETLRATIRIDANAAQTSRTVTVTNTDGEQGTLADAFAVSGTAPLCAFSVTSSLGVVGGNGTQGNPIVLGSVLAAFDASGSSDPDGTIVSYDWDFGDGSPGGSGQAVTHDYTTTTAPGETLQVVLTATDDDAESCVLVRFVQVP